MQSMPIREDVEGSNDQDSRNSCMEGRILFFVSVFSLVCVASPLAGCQTADATMFIFIYFSVIFRLTPAVYQTADGNYVFTICICSPPLSLR